MTVEEMKEKKRELGLSNEALSRLSGIPFSTIQKLFSGKTSAPRQKTVAALDAALRTAASGQYPSFSDSSPAGFVREPSSAYGVKKQGEYTLEDYYALPDEKRVELIDGEFFDMYAPSVTHQTILGELHLQFRVCADAHGMPCRVLLSPCDVQLDNDNKTMVQPDLIVVCREFDLSRRAFAGAPDLTVEILSDSTRSKDMLLKTYKYKNAGVREYWIIDPRRHEILVYDFSDEDLLPEKYTFSDRVPIHISDGSCSIDFSVVSRALGLD